LLSYFQQDLETGLARLGVGLVQRETLAGVLQ
jgi:hypothetical protein